MLSPLNRGEQVIRETLLLKAQGADFIRLCHHYGFDRPRYIDLESWRRALHQVLHSARGTPGPIFKFLEEVFSAWIQGPGRYTATASAVNIIANSDFDCRHEARFVRINGILHRTSYLRGSSFPGELVLYPIDTTLFSKAQFTPGETLTVDFLPFDIDERDAKYRILLDGGIFTIPGSYFRENGEERTTDPFGMHLMDFFSDVFTERFANVTDGPHPIYLDAKEFGSLFFNSLNLILAAGIIEEVQLVEWCPGTSSIYGDIVHSQRFGTASPDRPAIVTPTRS